MTERLVYTETICFPTTEWNVPSVPQVERALASACVDYRGWPFIFFLPGSSVQLKYGNDVISSLSNEPFYDRLKFDYWSFNYEKGILYSKNLTAESSIRLPSIVDPFVQVRLLAENLIAAARVFSSLSVGSKNRLRFTVRYSPMKGVKVGSINEYEHRIRQSSEFADDNLVHSIEDELSRFLNEPAGLSAEVISELVAKMGYQYNLASQLEKTAKDHLTKGQRPVSTRTFLLERGHEDVEI